jgi:hypothetical protein
MIKWYMKLFCIFLNTSVLNSLKGENTGKRIDKLSFKIWFVGGLLVSMSLLLNTKCHSLKNT